MTISSANRKSGPYNGNGVTTIFDYEFRIVDEDHLRVIKTSGSGVESILVIDTDYIVSDVGEAEGQVALVVAPATGETITILGNVPFVQEIDLENQGAFFAETVETGFDLAVMRDQQIQEQVDRAVKIPASADPSSLDTLIANIDRLSGSADNIDTVAAIAAEISTVADIDTAVSAVAGVRDEVVVVAGIAPHVVEVAAVAADIPVVADNVADINTFARVWQGSHAADPIERNNGTPLQEGDLYFNSVSDALRFYDGTEWRDATALALNMSPNSFVGTGAQTAFVLSRAPAIAANVLVWVGGTRLTPITDYTVAGTTLTLAVAPGNGIEVDTLVVATTSALAVPADGSVTADAISDDPAEQTAIKSKLGLSAGLPKPEDFGAVGDGVTNDTTALQAFFNNSQKRGELSPNKTYLVSTVTVPANSVWSGPRSAVIKKSNTAGTLVLIGGSFVKLSGFKVDGSHTDSSVASGLIDNHFGIESQYTAGVPLTDITIDGVEVVNCGESGIDLRLVTRVEVSRCLVHRCGYGGIMTWSGLDCLVRDNIIYDIFPGDASGGATAPFQNAYGATFSDWGGVDRIPERCTFLRNLVYDVPTWEGLDEHNGRYISFLDNTVIGCSQGIAGQHGTVGKAAYRITVRGNKIRGFGTSRSYNGQTCYSTGGIIVNGGSGSDTGANIVIADNQIEDCGDTRPSPGGSGAIKLENCWRFTLADNVIYAPHRIGIILTDNGTTSNRAGTVNGNVVSDVQSVGGVFRPFYFTGRSQALVRGNVAYGASSGTSAFEQAASPTYAADISDNRYWAS